jgi:hypothetical protein
VNGQLIVRPATATDALKKSADDSITIDIQGQRQGDESCQKGLENRLLSGEPPPPPLASGGENLCRTRLGGLLKHYYRDAAPARTSMGNCEVDRSTVKCRPDDEPSGRLHRQSALNPIRFGCPG